MTVRDDDLFDEGVAEWLRRAAADVEVDIEVEWLRLVDRLQREASELAAIDGPEAVSAASPSPAPRRTWQSTGPLLAVAAVVLVLLVIGAPVFVHTTVTVARLVQDVVDPPAPTIPEATTTTMPTNPPTFAPVPPPTPTPTSPPPPPTTAPPPVTTAPAQTDLAHAPIRDGNEYRLTVRQVHEQLNAAIGFGRSDYAALDGADDRVESLLGRQPQYDARLRDVIGHIRQARNFSDRNAASAAHTIVEEIERELALASP